jgi:hypothetical protein
MFFPSYFSLSKDSVADGLTRNCSIELTAFHCLILGFATEYSTSVRKFTAT